MTLKSLTSFFFMSSLCLAACGDDGKTTDTTGVTTTTAGSTTEPATGSTAATDNPSTTAATTEDPTGGTPSGQYCIEECAADADCKAMGMDLGLKCVDKVCIGDSSGGCQVDFDCTVLFSGWAVSCDANMPCFPGSECVDVGGGVGRCATTPGNGLTCDALGQVELMVPALAGGMVTVCGNDDFECKGGVCVDPCTADADCATVPGLPKCNTGTGQCECSTDADCAAGGVEGATVCKTTFCGCGTDADCTGPNKPNSDTCYDGLCGCSADAACTTKGFDGTTISCKSL